MAGLLALVSWNFSRRRTFQKAFDRFGRQRAHREPFEGHRLVDHDLRRVLPGAYVPTYAMQRPSRGIFESATTTR